MNNVKCLSFRLTLSRKSSNQKVRGRVIRVGRMFTDRGVCVGAFVGVGDHSVSLEITDRMRTAGRIFQTPGLQHTLHAARSACMGCRGDVQSKKFALEAGQLKLLRAKLSPGVHTGTAEERDRDTLPNRSFIGGKRPQILFRVALGGATHNCSNNHRCTTKVRDAKLQTCSVFRRLDHTGHGADQFMSLERGLPDEPSEGLCHSKHSGRPELGGAAVAARPERGCGTTTAEQLLFSGAAVDGRNGLRFTGVLSQLAAELGSCLHHREGHVVRLLSQLAGRNREQRALVGQLMHLGREVCKVQLVQRLGRRDPILGSKLE